MSPILVFVCYATSLALALFLLWRFHAARWYWHVFSILAAIGIGLTPFPEPFRGPGWDALVGTVFVFLFFWGIAAPFAGALHHRH
jgi:uncharacterized membrane protein YccC